MNLALQCQPCPRDGEKPFVTFYADEAGFNTNLFYTPLLEDAKEYAQTSADGNMQADAWFGERKRIDWQTSGGVKQYLAGIRQYSGSAHFSITGGDTGYCRFHWYFYLRDQDTPLGEKGVLIDDGFEEVTWERGEPADEVIDAPAPPTQSWPTGVGGGDSGVKFTEIIVDIPEEEIIINPWE